MKQTLFITGTDTGVGKTVLTVLLTRFLLGRGIHVAALKPVCSGGRDDARALHAASNSASTLRSSTATEDGLSLDEINPRHFRAPIAPALAARRERKRVTLAAVLAHVRAMQRRFDFVLIEGAGGLLSPLGENFDSRDLITASRATPIVVCPNRLGAVNQVLLALEALPPGAAARARVVLVLPPKPDASTRTNACLLAEHFNGKRIFPLPWFGGHFDPVRALKNPRLGRILHALARA